MGYNGWYSFWEPPNGHLGWGEPRERGGVVYSKRLKFQTQERVLFPLGPLEDLEKIGFQSLTPERTHGFHFKQEFPQSC